MSNNGFGVGVPAVTTTAGSIRGSVDTPVRAQIADGAYQLVTAYDDASVTLTIFDADWRPIGKTVVAQGIPSVTFIAIRPTRLTLGGQWTSAGADGVIMTQHSNFGARTFENAKAVDGTVALQAGSAVVVYAAPTGATAAQYAPYAVPVTGTSSRYWVGSNTVSTEITYRTRDNADTAIVTTPTQADSAQQVNTLPGKYPSVYGALRVQRGSTLRWRTQRLDSAMSLDISDLSEGEKVQLRRQVTADVAKPVAAADDTYFAGKAVYRLAQLADLAHQLGAAQAAADATNRLRAALMTWTEPRGCHTRDTACFVWDPQWKGIVGQRPSFGSERFSDHHFHYGYFLYAAAVLVKYDPSTLAKLKPAMSLLAADIASPVTTSYFPRLRGFDIFNEHSWASGTGQFDDGNDQESSAEAINAWAGLRLWAQATGDRALSDQASWMLSLESAAARAYWLDASSTLPNAYGRSIVGINFGNKRIYGTWFSTDPASILGIQLIPFSPAIIESLSAVPATQILRSTGEAVPDNNYNKSLADYVLMYRALASSSAASQALQTAARIDDVHIDSASSKTYLEAYLMLCARRHLHDSHSASY